MASWWETLGNPTLSPELRERLAEGIADARNRLALRLQAEPGAALPYRYPLRQI
jgi:hypothetical protein